MLTRLLLIVLAAWAFGAIAGYSLGLEQRRKKLTYTPPSYRQDDRR